MRLRTGSWFVRLASQGSIIAIIAACAGDATGPSAPAVIRMSVVSGNNQTGTVGTQLASALVIQALDGSNQPIANLLVNFEAATGGGTAYAEAVRTDASGNARDYWILGPKSGAQTLEVRVVNATTGTKTVYGSFTATANAAAAAKLIQVAGNLQDGYGAFAVATPPTVEVTDAFGNPKGGIGVTFTVASGGGSVTGGSTSTASDGTAKPAAWTLGGAPGINSLTATSGTLSGSPSTFLADALFSVKAISTGLGHSCELRADGAAYCTGDNTYGELGTGDAVSWLRMVPAAGGRMFSAIAAGGIFTCGVVSTGDAYCWGDNHHLQLGGLGSEASYVPLLVQGSHAFKSITAGLFHACGITTSGAGFCWGEDNYGQLGNNSTTPTGTPVAIDGSLTWAQLSAAGSNTCGVTTSGDGYCWGSNPFGGIGNGTTTEAHTPQAIAGGHKWRQVNTSGQHTCGVTTSNVAYCWGYNIYGQLGNGTTTQSTSPVQVSGGLAFQELQTNQYSVCALTTTGKGYCWGNSNGHGTLGNAVTSNETTPVAMSTGTTFQTLGTGKNFGQCAVARAGGAPWCWGLGSSGQLGTGFTSDAVTAPYKVLNP